MKPEDKSTETYRPPSSWPSRGAIEFHNVTSIHRYVSVNHYQSEPIQFILTAAVAERMSLAYATSVYKPNRDRELAFAAAQEGKLNSIIAKGGL